MGTDNARTFVLKVINNDRKLLTDHETIDRIAEQIELVITQVCRNIERDVRKRILLKKIKNHSKPLKIQQDIKICHKFTLQGGFNKVAHTVTNSKTFNA